MSRTGIVVAAFAALAGTVAFAGPPEPADVRATRSQQVDPRVRSLLDRLPLAFEVNRGQAPEQFDFLVRCRGYHAFVASDEVVFSFDGAGLAMSLDGAARVEPLTRGLDLPGKANYFLGDERAKWVTEIPTTRGAVYRDAAPGTTWTFSGLGRALEFAFELEPGAAAPALRFDGAAATTIADDGSLVLAMPHGIARISAPVAWQDGDGARVPAVARWVAAKDGVVRIDVAAKDASRRVHVDPTVTYETYLGGSQLDHCLGAAMDASGNAFLCGTTESSGFTTTSGAYDRSLGGGGDAYVAKLSADGQSLIYSTYIGGSAHGDAMQGIVVDSSGNAYVVGVTYSSDFPTTPGVYRPSMGGTGARGMMSALNSSGSSLLFSSYADNYPQGIAFGPQGSFYVNDTAGLARYTAGFASQAFYVMLLPTGPVPSGTFNVRDVASDLDGNAYVVGETSYPAIYMPYATTGAYQTTKPGGIDTFLGKYDSSGSAVYWTWLGGSGSDDPYGVAVNLAGQAYVVGNTYSSDFPITSGAYKSSITSTSQEEAFVTRFEASGSSLRYSTYLGRGIARAIAVHSGSSYVIGGYTADSSFGLSNAFQSTYAGSDDGFAMKFERDNTLAWSSYAGGSSTENILAVGMGPDGSVVLGGLTWSSDMPTVSAYQSSYGTNIDAFALKIPDTLPVVTRLAITTPSLPTWTVSYAYSQAIEATGGVGPHTWSMASGTLPPGINMSSTGLVSGTPTQTGSYVFVARVDDPTEMVVERQFTLRINPPPSIAAALMPDATRDTSYDRVVPVVDGSGTMTFALTGGATPPGTALDANGRVSGTPTQTGDYSFSVRVTDGRGATGEGTVSIRVNVLPSVSDTPVPDGTEGRPHAIQFAATGGSLPIKWSVVAGDIPTLTAIDPDLGRLSGTAKQSGTYSFTVRATDAAGAAAERQFIATVNPLPQITAVEFPPAAAGRPYSFAIPRSGGTAPFTWAVDTGDLPAGMTLDEPTGTLRGTPTTPPGLDVTFACTDTTGARVTGRYTIRVAGLVDLTKRSYKEKVQYALDTPRPAPRFVELTEGSLLSIDVVGGAFGGIAPDLHVYDASGAEWDLIEWRKDRATSVKVKDAVVPATGRYFVTATAAGGFTGKMKVTVRIEPAAKWSSGGTLDGAGSMSYRFSAPPGALVSISAKAAKDSAALPRIVSVIAPDATNLVPGGKTTEKGGLSKFASKVPLAGGDYRVVFATRDATAGDVAWTVKLKLPSTYEFALPDVAAGD